MRRAIVGLVAVAAVCGLMLVGCGEKEDSARMKEIKVQRVAQGFVLANLKDPESAEFRDQKGLCGEVNAKNSFGGYTGFKRFMAASEEMVVIEGGELMEPSEFNKAWNQMCAD